MGAGGIVVGIDGQAGLCMGWCMGAWVMGGWVEVMMGLWDCVHFNKVQYIFTIY